jgi:putative hydrolase of the HAD superfamily
LNDCHPSSPVLHPVRHGFGEGGSSARRSEGAVRAVTLDVGGTLIQPWPSVGHVYAAVALRHGLQLSPDDLNRRFAGAWRAKRDFSHTQSGWAELVDRTFAGLVETPPSRSFFPALYAEFASPSAWRIYDDVLPCLEQLRRRGLKLGAISNWDERLRPLLQGLKLDTWFDAIVISVEAGAAKPQPAIFQRAAEQLQTDPAAILHLGDSRAEDFEGARAAGFQALLVRRGEPSRANEQISSLAEALLRL